MKRILFSSAFLLIGFWGQAQQEWINLYNGQNLDGWRSYGGNAPFEAAGEEIVGTAVLNTPNTFLCTEEQYGDYIFEVDFYDEPPLNTGVMARGQWRQDGETRRVYGYQVEIDPSQRDYSGGIYDEQRRGWLYPVSYNPDGHGALQAGEWNHLRIEFVGKVLRTYLNDIPVANLVDDLDQAGMICLQVHSISEALKGKKVRWRKPRILTNARPADMRTDPAPELSVLTNQITATESRQGWHLLWDGRTLQGWNSPHTEVAATDHWRIVEGELRATGDAPSLVSEYRYRDFDLRFDFKPASGASAGFLYLIEPGLDQIRGRYAGLEYRISDDRQDPLTGGPTPAPRSAAALNWLVNPEVLATPRSKELHVDGWNRGRIVVRGGQVEHWINGFKVIDINRHTQLFGALIARSPFGIIDNFGQRNSGHVVLKSTQGPVAFRSIKIRAL